MKIKREIARAMLLILIFATLAFIFVQSMLPKEASKAQSDAVGEIIEEIIPPETPTGQYVQKNIRKIAHFVEFAVLGAELALYVAFFMKRRLFIALSYPAALLAALFDETVQMFSGRGSAIFDVWIDFFGFFIFASITYAAYFAVFYFYKWLKGTKFSDGKNN